MNEPKFKVGDKVRVLDGAKICGYAGNWVNSMAECVGKVCEVVDVEPWCSLFYAVNTFKYRLKGERWNFDERGLELAEDEELGERIIIYREGRKVIAKNELTGEKGVAKCSPEDEFDFWYGADLALKRVNTKDFKVGDKVVLKYNCIKGTITGFADTDGLVYINTSEHATLVYDVRQLRHDNTPEYFTGKENLKIINSKEK